MHFFTQKSEFEKFRKSISVAQSIGFVPTMGALHEGHLSLFRQSLKDNALTIASIFVNPTQFNNAEDLANYPNPLEADKNMLSRLGVDVLFAPNIEEMYPNGLEVENIDLHGLDKVMEGTHRPGHFEGMATIVKRLLRIVNPNTAYFGEKDFQQLAIIRNMVKDDMPQIEIIGMPIVREENGLAMSSRNLRLTEIQKEKATVIYRTLKELKKHAVDASPSNLLQLAYKNFAFSSLELDYCTIAETTTLKEVEQFQKDQSYRAFIAAFCGDVRLIDNIELL